VAGRNAFPLLVLGNCIKLALNAKDWCGAQRVSPSSFSQGLAVKRKGRSRRGALHAPVVAGSSEGKRKEPLLQCVRATLMAWRLQGGDAGFPPSSENALDWKGPPVWGSAVPGAGSSLIPRRVASAGDALSSRGVASSGVICYK